MTNTVSLTPATRPGLILSLICLPVFIGALDLTIISAVLPAVIADLKIPAQTGLDDAAWAVNGYLLAYAVSMTFMGRVSDIWGRKRVYLLCLSIFFAGSWLAAASGGAPAQLIGRITRIIAGGRPDAGQMGLYALIAGRVVQAFGAGAMVPVSMAFVGDLYPAERRALPLGIVGAVDTAGWVLGHLYGGIVVQFFPWPFLFWINLPIVAVMFGVIIWALRNVPAMAHPARLDWPGAVTISLALVGLNLGLGSAESSTPGTVTAQSAPFSPGAVAAILFGIACLGLFLWIESRTAEPLLNLSLFRDRNFSTASGLNFMIGLCLMAGLVSVPLFINVAGAQSSGQGALVSGYLLSAFTVPMALAAIPGGWLTDRAGYRVTTLFGLVIALAGFGLMTRWRPEMAAQAVAVIDGVGSPEDRSGIVQMIVGLLGSGIGLGLTVAPIGTAVINAVSDSERGAASALVIILRLVGMSASVSALTAYGLRRFNALNAERLADVPITEAARIFEVVRGAATQVTVEIALIALGVCAAAVAAATLLRARR